MNRVRNPSQLAVSCSGRFGRRRVRVNQCWLILRAEETYDSLPRDVSKDRHTFTVSAEGWRSTVTAELRPNLIWRRGRLFYRCAHCGNRATRLYVPIRGLDLRCRSCWGLSYESRSWSYHGFMGWANALCKETTQARRAERTKSRLQTRRRKSSRRASEPF